MMIMQDTNWKIWLEEKQSMIHFEGSLRLWDPGEYLKIKQFMLEIYELELQQLNLDFTKLDFLNSSGISMLCKFIFEAKRQNRLMIHIIGKDDVLWQKKSLLNLQKLWDQVELEFK